MSDHPPETDLLLEEFHEAGIYLPGELAACPPAISPTNELMEVMMQGFQLLAEHTALVLEPTKGSTHELR